MNTENVKESILVIDDSLDQLDLQRLVLEMEGFEVFTARDAAEAIKVLDEKKKMDLILLDFNIKDMTGDDFLNILEKEKPEVLIQVPIVYLTGMEEVPQSRVAGMISKVIDMSHYLASVHHYIEIGHRSPYTNL